MPSLQPGLDTNKDSYTLNHPTNNQNPPKRLDDVIRSERAAKNQGGHMKPRIASQWALWKGIRRRRHAFAKFMKRRFARTLIEDCVLDVSSWIR